MLSRPTFSTLSSGGRTLLPCTGGSRWRHRTPVSSGRTRALNHDDLPPNPDASTVQEIITIFTAEGVHRIPGRRIPIDPSEAGGFLGATRSGLRGRQQPMPTWEEQTLCIGASFAVSATNGRDPTRRVNIVGFCQSVDYLQEAVEDTVFSRGGEVLEKERRLKSGVHEVLRLTVAIPFLFGVPPELEALSEAIVQGGGIVDKVVRQWDIYTPETGPLLQPRPIYSSGFGYPGTFGPSSF